MINPHLIAPFMTNEELFSYHKKFLDQFRGQLTSKPGKVLADLFVLKLTSKDYRYMDLVRMFEAEVRKEQDPGTKAIFTQTVEAFKKEALAIGKYTTQRQNIVSELSRPSCNLERVTIILTAIKAHVDKMESLATGLPQIPMQPLQFDSQMRS